MSDEIFLEGKTYVSSRRAATQTGYAQDYIGQLARSGQIDAQRVGGLWYVTIDSLAGYQRNAASYVPAQPQKTQQDLDAIVSFDGKDYISASRAAKLSGYNQDYIGQLARSGKILSRQIGNRWYIDREMLLAHKAQKDSMLAAVQAESVGLVRAEPQRAPEAPIRPVEPQSPLLTYIAEEKDLLPLSQKSREYEPVQPVRITPQTTNPLPIKRIVTAPIVHTEENIVLPRSNRRVSRSKTALLRVGEAGIALTFVIVLSYGVVTLKSSSIYAVNFHPHLPSSVTGNALSASAYTAGQRVLDLIEGIVAPEVSYRRNQ
jgi:hypothetical protein